jgi:methanogenic corrinoid protein MtbC1
MSVQATTMRLVPAVSSNLLDRYVSVLLSGERAAARKLVDAALSNGNGGGLNAATLLADLVWPVMERIQAAYKDDSINQTQLNLATRLNRFVADLLGSRLEQAAPVGKTALVFCGDDEPEELGGQITADLFEAAGWSVKFGGGGVPSDEILKMIGAERPDLLVMFATLPSGVPAVRKLIDYLREVNANPDMQILCCGGIYKRAEGLAEEIGADLFAPDAHDAVRVAANSAGKRATVDQQTVGRMRRIRKAQLRRVDRVAPDATVMG